MSTPEHIAELLKTVAILRSKDGCPWDYEQSSRSLLPYFIEEVCEVLDAVDDDDVDALKEELGDLLIHIAFQSDIASRGGRFAFGEVAESAIAKLKRRHPHIFGKNKRTLDSATVERNWQAIKRAEKRHDSAFKELPRQLPSLSFARYCYGQLVLLDLEPYEGVAEADDSERRLGRELFELVVKAHRQKIDPEAALRRECRRLQRLVQECERVAGSNLFEMEAKDRRQIWGGLLK